MVDRAEPAGEVVGLFVGGGDCDAEAERCGCGGHGGDDGKGLVDGPLCASADRRVKARVIHIVATEDICDEDTVKFPGF